MLLQRRSFLTGLGASLIASPAIVRAGSLMPVKAIEWTPIRPIFYANRTIRAWIDIEAIRDRNILLRIEDYAGIPLHISAE
jgi:hypothetical protein